MIDFTLAELLTGLDMSDAEQFSESIIRPKLVRTDGPLETDASFRARCGDLFINDPQWQIANGHELDAIGALHGLIRHGYRLEEAKPSNE